MMMRKGCDTPGEPGFEEAAFLPWVLQCKCWRAVQLQMGVFANGRMGNMNIPSLEHGLFRQIEVLILFSIEQPVNLTAVVLQDFGVR